MEKLFLIFMSVSCFALMSSEKHIEKSVSFSEAHIKNNFKKKSTLRSVVKLPVELRRHVFAKIFDNDEDMAHAFLQMPAACALNLLSEAQTAVAVANQYDKNNKSIAQFLRLKRSEQQIILRYTRQFLSHSLLKHCVSREDFKLEEDNGAIRGWFKDRDAWAGNTKWLSCRSIGVIPIIFFSINVITMFGRTFISQDMQNAETFIQLAGTSGCLAIVSLFTHVWLFAINVEKVTL